MAKNRIPGAVPSDLDPSLKASGPAAPHIGLQSVEAQLSQAREDADRLEQPVVAYFIDMAIAEVRREARLMQESANRHSGRKTLGVAQLID